MAAWKWTTPGSAGGQEVREGRWQQDRNMALAQRQFFTSFVSASAQRQQD